MKTSELLSVILLIALVGLAIWIILDSNHQWISGSCNYFKDKSIAYMPARCVKELTK